MQLGYPLPHHPRTLQVKKAVRPEYQSVQDARQWQVMARCIQQQAPVREAGKVLNFRLVDKELCGPNTDHVRTQRELTMGVGWGMRKSLPRSLKSHSVTVLQGNCLPTHPTPPSQWP